LQQNAQRVAGAAEIPATVLFCQSPDGLNATGDSDMRQFYDRITQYTGNSIVPKLGKILSIIAQQEVDLEFESLWEPTLKEAGEARMRDAQADQIWYQMGAVDSSEVALSRSRDGSLGIDIDQASREATIAAVKNRISVGWTPAQLGLVTLANDVRISQGWKALPEFDGKTIAQLENALSGSTLPDTTLNPEPPRAFHDGLPEPIAAGESAIKPGQSAHLPEPKPNV
jgi:hypothetical protein